MRCTLCILSALCVVLGAQAATPTFNKEVVRIFQRQCQTCHHPGDIGPFSLMDYQSARPYAPLIKARVMDRSMPPWKPLPGEGDFRDARVLTAEEIETLRQWADAGAPEGDARDSPPLLTFPDGWVLGQPNLVLTMPEFSVPAGRDVYRCFSLDTELTQDRYIRAIQVRPGNRAMVHHVLLFSDPLSISQLLDSSEPGPGYTCYGGPGFTPDPSFFGGWAPGLRPTTFEPGLGMQLRSGSRISMQVHYHPKDGGLTDRTQIGLYFSNTPVDKIVRALPLANTTFTIPAGNPRHEVQASLTIPRGLGLDAHVVSIVPHMHLLGREIRVQVVFSDGRALPLIHIDDWDFEWQALYEYRVPIAIPGGTRLEFSAYYDNSANNPRNPNSPPKDVRWGEQTTDEMALVFFGVTLDCEHLAPLQISAGGVVNAASYAGGALAPGAIVSLFGLGLTSGWGAAAALPLPRRLGGDTRVTVGGVEAPLFYASPSQINFQIPFEVSTATATITATRSCDGGQQSVSVPLAQAQPGIFTFTGDPRGPAAAVHAVSGALVSAADPAARGEWISLYATGLGAVTPSVASGAPPPDGMLAATLTMPVVTVGGARAEVSFSGLAPGFAGLYQVNFRIPAEVAAGAAVPLKLSIVGIESNSTTIAIQ